MNIAQNAQYNYKIDAIDKSVDGFLLYNGNKVHPELNSLLNVPISYVLGLRYSSNGYKNPSTTKHRYFLLNYILESINETIKDVAEEYYLGKNTVRGILISEYDHVLLEKPEMHSHFLFHIHPEAVSGVAIIVWNWLSNLVNKPHKGIAECYLQSVYEQNELGSYVCKVSRTPEQDGYKEFLYSKGFVTIIKKCHQNQQFKYQGEMVAIGSPQDPYLAFRNHDEVKPQRLLEDESDEPATPKEENIVEKLERISKMDLPFIQKGQLELFPHPSC